jgi:hypothetical protein
MRLDEPVTYCVYSVCCAGGGPPNLIPILGYHILPCSTLLVRGKQAEVSVSTSIGGSTGLVLIIYEIQVFETLSASIKVSEEFLRLYFGSLGAADCFCRHSNRP